MQLSATTCMLTCVEQNPPDRARFMKVSHSACFHLHVVWSKTHFRVHF